MQVYTELPTPKGVMRGFFHRPVGDKFPVCIIFHGFTGQVTGTKFSYVQLSRMLEGRGIGTLRFDFLGSGESDLNFKDMTFKDELACARLILEQVMKLENCSEIYLLGHSMGGAIASELSKLYPNVIKKMVLWAPAFSLPDSMEYLTGIIPPSKDGFYDHDGYEVSQEFVDDILGRNLYLDLNKYQNDLLIIHGTKDTTVPFEISKKYLKAYQRPIEFVEIVGGDHSFNSLKDIKKALKISLDFLSKKGLK